MARFGKHAPKHDYRTLRFGSYAAGLATPPASYDQLARVYDKTRISDPAKLFPMDGNDRYGDCTIAGLAHAVTTYRGLVESKPVVMGEQTVVKLYFHLSGGVDSGLNMLDVLGYWRKHKVSGDAILNYVKIDPRNHEHVKQAIHLFGGVYLGFQVQQDCEKDFNARKPWTPGKLTHDGHAVYAVGYDSHDVTVLTWGSTQKGTWKWWDECVDEAYAILPPESLQKGFAPGFDFNALKDDLAAVAN